MNDSASPVNPVSPLADTIPPADDRETPVSLPAGGCIPLPPCEVCGEDVCDHERVAPSERATG